MTDKEKVLHGLDSCGFYDGIPNICEVTECPYRDDKAYCVHELAHDAGMLISELLKAQEPVVPVFDAGDGKTIGQFLCGKCHSKIGFGHPHFCWYCGQAVKWECVK